MSTTQAITRPTAAAPAESATDLLDRIEALEAELRRLTRQRRRQRRDGELDWKPWMPKFLGVLRQTGGNASAGIRAVEASRRTVYQHKERCPEFGGAWEAVLAEVR